MKKLSIYLCEGIDDSQQLSAMRDYIMASLEKCDSETISKIYNKVKAETSESKSEVLDLLSRKFSLGDTESSKSKKSNTTSKEVIETVYDFIVKQGVFDDVVEMLKQNKVISRDDFLRGGNIFELVKNLGFGFTKDFIEKLINITPKNQGKAMGPYEVFLQLFVEGGHISRVGDLGLEPNDVVELKAPGARLTGQSGNGKGWNKGSARVSRFEDLIKNRKYSDLKDIWKNYESDFEQDNCQMFYKTDGCGFYRFINAVKETKDNKLYDKLIEVFAEVINVLYQDNLNIKELTKFLTNCDVFNRRDNKIDGKKICDVLAACDLYYYMDISTEFTYIGLIGKNGLYNVFSRESISDIQKCYNITSSSINCGAPNTKKNATPQDSFASVTIVSVN